MTVDELRARHAAEAKRLGIPVVPVLVPTGWDIGPVAAFLFPSDPVTLVDAGFDDDRTQDAVTEALASAGRRVQDLRRIIVTHGHNDHIGGARRLQDASGCQVLIHREDVPASAAARSEQRRTGMHAVGMTPETMERVFGARAAPRERRYPLMTTLEGGEVFETGGRHLRVEHHAGHSPGHLWMVDEDSGAVFAGDYLLAAHPTNAGLEPHPENPARRRPMLRLYHEGLAELARRDAPVVFPGHGPPIADHRDLIARRMDKSRRRTEHVLRVVTRTGPGTPFEMAVRMYGQRIVRNAFDILADVVGRLDLLAEEGRVLATFGDDGVWRFAPAARLD